MAGGPVGGNQGGDFIAQPVPFDTTQITSVANYSNPKAGDPCHPLAAGMHAPAIAFPGRMSATQCASTEELSPSLCSVNPTAVAFNMHKSGNDSSSMGVSEDRTDCLRAFEKSPFAVQPAPSMMVRRLTPEECEALQGFPRSYTAITWRKKSASECPDGPRYKSLGNSWAVPNVRWIGQRIDMVQAIREQQKEAA
jgi:DNA (cytosine-5)-methyltransferase 1